jgi:hypothetical protein
MRRKVRGNAVVLSTHLLLRSSGQQSSPEDMDVVDVKVDCRTHVMTITRAAAQ